MTIYLMDRQFMNMANFLGALPFFFPVFAFPKALSVLPFSAQPMKVYGNFVILLLLRSITNV